MTWTLWAVLLVMDVQDIGRIGLFFVAFGTAGRQLMHSLLVKFPPNPPPRIDSGAM